MARQGRTVVERRRGNGLRVRRIGSELQIEKQLISSISSVYQVISNCLMDRDVPV